MRISPDYEACKFYLLEAARWPLQTRGGTLAHPLLVADPYLHSRILVLGDSLQACPCTHMTVQHQSKN